MRRLIHSFLFVLAACGLGAGASLMAAAEAGASCAAPEITVDPSSGKAGAPFHVKGKGFAKACNDTVGPGDSSPGSAPDTGIKIYFTQGKKTWLIGTGNASPDDTFDAEVFVPNGDGVAESPYGQSPEPGAATVRAEGSLGKPTAAFTVEPGGATTTTRPIVTTSSTAKSSTTTSSTGSTTSTTTLDAETTSTILEASSTTSTTRDVTDDTVSLNDEGDVGGDDTPNTAPLAALALVGLAGVLGVVIWRSRRTP